MLNEKIRIKNRHCNYTPWKGKDDPDTRNEGKSKQAKSAGESNQILSKTSRQPL